MIGKNLADRWGWTEKLGGVKNETVKITTEVKKKELDRLKKDIQDCNTTAQVDVVIKEHGLSDIEGLPEHIKELYEKGEVGNLQKSDVNKFITNQNNQNIADQAHGIKGVKKAIDAYNESLIKNEDGTTKASESTKKFLSTLSATNPKLADCMNNAKGGSIGFSDYARSLATATLKTIGLQAATTAMNAAVSFGISLVIQGLASGISYLINYKKIHEEAFQAAKEATEECANAIRDLKSEMSDTTTKAKELASEYAKLVQGVDPRTNKNETLSVEDYEKFLDVNKQLAELLPSIKRRTDDNGNAIFDLSGDIDTVTESITRLIEKQNALTKSEMLGKLDEYVSGTDDNEGIFTVLDKYSKDAEKAQKEQNKFKKEYEKLINGSGKIDFKDDIDANKYLVGVKENFGQDAYDALYKEFDRQIWEEQGGNSFVIDFSKIELDETTRGKITASYNTLYNELQTDASAAALQLETKNKEMSDNMMVWVEDSFDLYKNGDTAFQTAIENMVGSIKWDQVGVEEGNLDDAKDIIQTLVIAPLTTACDDPDKKLQITNALNKLFTVDFSQMSFQDANKMIEEFLTPIMEALNKGVPDDQKKSMPDMYEMFGLGSYSETENKMKESLASIAEEGSADYAEMEEYTSKLNQSQTEIWLSVTKGANGATNAINKCEQALADISEAESAPISFFEAWEHLQSVGEKAKDVTPELLKLAKAGEISDATLMSNEDYVTLLTETKMSARDARREIMSMLSVQEKMSGLQGKMGNVETLYSEFKDKGFVTAETLESLPEVFKQINGGKDFDLFSQIVGDPTSGKEKIQQAFNDIVTAYIKDQDILVGATEETRDAIIANLSDAGVTNAEAVVDSAIKAHEKSSKLLKKAYEEYEEHINAKGELDENYLQQTGTMNARLEAMLGETYKTDLENWKTALQQKANAYNAFVTALGNASGKTTQEKFQNKMHTATSDSDRANISQKAANYYTAYKNEQDAQNALKVDLETVNLNFDSIQFSPSSSGGSGGGSGSSKTSNNTVIDWISKKLDRLNDKISLTQAKYENLVDTLGKNRGKKKKKLAKNSDGLLEAQIENLDEQIKQYNKLAKAEKKAVQRYDKKAKGITISKNKKENNKLKKAVRNGKIGTKKTKMKDLIATYGEKKAKKIQEYEQWYDAARNAEKDYESARSSSRKKKEEKYQIQADAAQAKISMYQSQAAHATDDYATQNKYLKEQSKWIAKNYDMQIAIANLNKDTVLAAELQAQKAEELAQLEKQKFDNIQADFENRRSAYQMKMDVIEAQNNLLEAKGQKIQASSYENEIKQEQETLETYKAEKTELEKQIKKITKGTEEWYRAKEAINKCDVEIINCTASAAELNNKITEIANNAKTALQNAFATMASEGDLFAELMSNKDLFDSETGIITKEGLATLGTYGNGYNVSKASAEVDHSLIKMLQAGLNHDFNKGAYSFIDSNNEKRVYNSLDQLEDAVKEVYEDWREQIKNTFEYESKIIDMMRDKLENELSALKDLIDAKKNALSAEKALHDYRKSIKESTENISSLQKQIIAVQGDTSEAGIARIQKLQNELKQQEQSLEEKEYDHLIQAEQDMLDNLYDEYSDLITNEMQDTRRLLDKGFAMIESSAGTINQTIKDYSGKYDYTPEYRNHMNSGSGDILNDAKGEKNSSTGGGSLIQTIKGYVAKAKDYMAKFGLGGQNEKWQEQKPKEEILDVLNSIIEKVGDIRHVKGFKDGGIAKVIKSKGEDGLVMTRNGEGFVKPEHVGEVKKLLDALPQLNAAMNYQIDMPKMPEVKPVQVSPNQVVEIGNVTLPNVTNYEEFKTQMFKDMQKDTKFEKMLQSMTISKIATPQHNRFSKNSIRF